jgi:hypothetical protein
MAPKASALRTSRRLTARGKNNYELNEEKIQVKSQKIWTNLKFLSLQWTQTQPISHPS